MPCVPGPQVGVEERRCLTHDLLEGGDWVELRRQEPADVGQPLRERVGSPLALEQLRPLEGAASGTRQVPREGEILVGEASLLAEEDDHGLLLPLRAEHGSGDQRAVALAGEQVSEAFLEPVVAFERRRREDAALLRRGAERRDVAGDTSGDPLSKLGRQLVRPGEHQAAPRRLEDES
jgi:hypothetical protein